MNEVNHVILKFSDLSLFPTHYVSEYGMMAAVRAKRKDAIHALGSDQEKVTNPRYFHSGKLFQGSIGLTGLVTGIYEQPTNLARTQLEQFKTVSQLSATYPNRLEGAKWSILDQRLDMLISKPNPEPIMIRDRESTSEERLLKPIDIAQELAVVIELAQQSYARAQSGRIDRIKMMNANEQAVNLLVAVELASQQMWGTAKSLTERLKELVELFGVVRPSSLAYATKTAQYVEQGILTSK